MKNDLYRERIVQQSRGAGKTELQMAWLNECNEMKIAKEPVSNEGLFSREELEEIMQELHEEPKEQDEFIYVDQPQTISKRDTIRQLRRALEAAGHTKARAKELAKVHYKSFVKMMRG